MKGDRHNELLLGSAQELEAGHVILSGAFLHEHGVDADEAWAVANTIASILRGYLRLDPELKAMILLLGIDTEQKIPAWIALDNANAQRTIRRMQSGEDKEESYFSKEK